MKKYAHPVRLLPPVCLIDITDKVCTFHHYLNEILCFCWHETTMKKDELAYAKTLLTFSYFFWHTTEAILVIVLCTKVRCFSVNPRF